MSNKNANANLATVDNKDVDVIQTMKQRISDLAVSREKWETTEYDRSNQGLYKLIGECLALYNDLTKGKDLQQKKVALKQYIDQKGYAFKDTSPLSLKVIRCVFGDRDRRRLSTYHTVLRVAIDEEWAVADVAAKISEKGGVQEISLEKRKSMTAKEKTIAARDALVNQNIATLASDKISKQFDIEKVGEPAVAVLVLNADGSYSVQCVVHNTSAVNAVLAGYFSENKEALKNQKEQQIKQNAEAQKAQLIATAAIAANDDQSKVAA